MTSNSANADGELLFLPLGGAAEIGMNLTEIAYTKKRLAGWMKPERVPTALIAQPGRSVIVWVMLSSAPKMMSLLPGPR